MPWNLLGNFLGNGNKKSKVPPHRRWAKLAVERLEDRTAPSITQLTNDAFDHRWPSNNRHYPE